MARLRNRVDEMDRVVPVPACFNARLESVGRLRLGRPNLEPEFPSLCGELPFQFHVVGSSPTRNAFWPL